MAPSNLTLRQQKWFATVRAGLERDTGRSMAEWVIIARACPETTPRARLKWFKETHGLLQNRASMVLAEAFGAEMRWEDPQALTDRLWSDPGSRAIFEAVRLQALALPAVVETARKGYSAWSHRVQFAALRPVRGGAARLGLGLMAKVSTRLASTARESWSERLKAGLTIASPDEVDAELQALLRLAWEGA